MAQKITQNADGSLNVADEPIIPFIEGDGTGVDIWPAAQLVLDAAAEKHGKTIAWKEVLAGEKAFNNDGRLVARGDGREVPREPHRDQGPAHHADRRRLPLAQRRAAPDPRSVLCLRPVRYFQGVPSPVKHPEQVDMVIFRENTEDVYAGIEVKRARPRPRSYRVVASEFGWDIRADSGIGIKPISETGRSG